MNISATRLECVTGDVVVPRGQSIEIVTHMRGLLRASAMMAISPATATVAPEEMELKPVADKPGMLNATVDADASFRYRVQAGDGRTEWHSVTAIDFPALSDIRLTVTPPDYVDEPVTEKTLIPGRIRAIQGSQFELAMKPEQNLKTLTLVLTLPAAEKSEVQPDESEEISGSAAIPEAHREPDEARTIQKSLMLTRGIDVWYHYDTQLVEDFMLSPLLVSPHGLTNENFRICRIEVIEDKAPVARIISPNAETSVSPDETIQIKFEAHDDHGIATAELVIYDTETKDGEKPKILAVKQIPLGDQQLRKHVTGKTELDLKELGLEEGRSISYAVRVTDNRMLEIDPESDRNRLIASMDPKSESESDNKEPPEPRFQNETGDTNNNAKTDAEESLSQTNADSRAGDPKAPSETFDNNSKEGEPNAADQESSQTNTLIADVGDQPESAESYEQVIANDRESKDGTGDPKPSVDSRDGSQGNKSSKPEDSKENDAQGEVVKIETPDNASSTSGDPDSDADPESEFSDLKSQIADISDNSRKSDDQKQNTAFEFVGLQMIDISSSHVTPARDAVFVAIRKPDSGADVHAEEALHHVVSARELLQPLLKKYDSVAQEKELAKKIDEAIKMYTVFVEGSQQLLAEAQQTFDPLKLQREMAVVEVDQTFAWIFRRS